MAPHSLFFLHLYMIDKLSKYGPSIFSTMTGLALEHDALNLAQGFPDFPTDTKLIACVDQAMKDGSITMVEKSMEMKN